MSAVSAVRVTAEDPGDASLAAVLGAGFAAAGQRAARLAALLDPGFLAEAGWDPVTRVLAPESEHRLIRWDGERLRLEAPARREGPAPRVPDGKCTVTACLRERQARRGREESRCALHARRWEAALAADPRLDARRWNERAEPVPVTGQVNLRGLAPLAVVEVLYGLQQRGRAGCTSYCRTLRSLAAQLRQAQAASLARPARPAGEGAAGAAELADHACGPCARRPAVGDREGQVGPGRPGTSRLARLHPHQPGVAARVGQGLGLP